MAREAGFQAAHALPMRLREQVIGAANIFHPRSVTLSQRDLHVAQALTDVATIGILQERAVRSSTDLSQQLQGASRQRTFLRREVWHAVAFQNGSGAEVKGRRVASS